MTRVQVIKIMKDTVPKTVNWSVDIEYVHFKYPPHRYHETRKIWLGSPACELAEGNTWQELLDNALVILRNHGVLNG